MSEPSRLEIDYALRLAERFYPYRDDFSIKQIRKIWTALGITKELRAWVARKNDAK
jgi:hypothetical protein